LLNLILGMYLICLLSSLYLTFYARADDRSGLSANSIYLSPQCIEKCRKLMESCDFFSRVNFMVGYCSLNSASVWSVFVFLWS
jgi:hypothetical protein